MKRSDGFPRAVLALAALCLTNVSSAAQGQCPMDFCDVQITSICDAGGFRITLTNYAPAPPSDGGVATYTYQVCEENSTVCSDPIDVVF